MPNTVKNEKEIQALDELVSGVQRDQIDLRKRVDALVDRFTLLDTKFADIDKTILDMQPLLKKNTDLTERSQKEVTAIKHTVDRIEPALETILEIVTITRERQAARAFVARWARFWKSTSATVAAMVAALVALGGFVVAASKYFAER